MIYIFFSSVFVTLFLVLGTLSLLGFLDLARKNAPINCDCYHPFIVLALIAFLCFIAACIFGIQIPDCYATTIL